jgi:hypothetical protein
MRSLRPLLTSRALGRRPRSAGSLWTSAVSVSIEESSWLVLGASTLTSPFVLFCGKVRLLHHSGLMASKTTRSLCLW